MKNRRGLSTIVTTLIIILLVLIATAIIWSVVDNLLSKNTEAMGTSAMCMEVSIRATTIVNNSLTNYSVTLSRTSSGPDEFFYAKLVFSNDTDSSNPLDFSIGLKPLYSKKENIESGILDANKLEITPYYKDESGKTYLCPTTSSFKF